MYTVIIYTVIYVVAIYNVTIYIYSGVVVVLGTMVFTNIF